jgi:hypothetical protein
VVDFVSPYPVVAQLYVRNLPNGLAHRPVTLFDYFEGATYYTQPPRARSRVAAFDSDVTDGGFLG